MSTSALRRFGIGPAAPRIAAWVAIVVAALLCAWLAVVLVWSFLTPLAPSLPVPATRPAATAKPSTDVARWHLFGNGQRNRLAIAVATGGARTSLKLILHGTVADTDARAGYALIADDHGVEHSYHVGDRVLDGVTLAAVYPDRVVLDNHGKHETLALPKQSLQTAPATAAGSRPASGAAARGAGSGRHGPIYVAPNIAVNRIGWQQARTAIRDNPAKALADLHIEPVMDGTKLEGVRLGGGASNPIARAAGLDANDVITAVNGVPLDSFARGQQLMNKLKGASHVTLTVRRNGETRSVDVDLPPSL